MHIYNQHLSFIVYNGSWDCIIREGYMWCCTEICPKVCILENSTKMLPTLQNMLFRKTDH